MTTTMEIDGATAVSRTRLFSIVEAALHSSLNRHVVRSDRHVDDGWLETRIGKNTLVENHILNGGVGELTPEARAYLDKINS